jgi:hypothetical protein
MPSGVRLRPLSPFGSRWLVSVCLFGMLFLGVVGTAAADEPGDGSAPDQYQEDIPTSTGSEPTDDSDDGKSDQGGSAPVGGSSSSGGGGTSAGGGQESGSSAAGSAREDRMTGPGTDGEGSTGSVPRDPAATAGRAESSGGISGAVTAAGEASPHVLALLMLALAIPLAAAAGSAVRARRRRA